jgi:hypothetical protein
VWNKNFSHSISIFLETTKLISWSKIRGTCDFTFWNGELLLASRRRSGFLLRAYQKRTRTRPQRPAHSDFWLEYTRQLGISSWGSGRWPFNQIMFMVFYCLFWTALFYPQRGTGYLQLALFLRREVPIIPARPMHGLHMHRQVVIFFIIYTRH